MTRTPDPLSARRPLPGHDGVDYYAISALDEAGIDTSRLPYTVRVLLEMLLRHSEGPHVSEADIRALGAWPAPAPAGTSVPFIPARVILQDFTGVPTIADLAAMRDQYARMGGDPDAIDPHVPVDLVIDHSVQVDAFGTRFAYERNMEREYERNGERYRFFRWAQGAFGTLRVVPPGMGIVHQVNLEHLAHVVDVREHAGGPVALPDTLVGTDSHTTMINALGVLGWGVGGIEAEAAMLGQPLPMPEPTVIGFEFRGALQPGVTATDLVLTVTERLRAYGVVGRFVEFTGDGLSALSIPDRATLSNMAPEFGATAATFPVDRETVRYLEATGREEHAPLVEAYCRAQGLFREDGQPIAAYSDVLVLDLSEVEPSLAGPSRPQDRVALGGVRDSFRQAFPRDPSPVSLPIDALVPEGAAGRTQTAADCTVDHGSVVIAAITSCTNTSNPSVMVAAGLLARNAVARGLETKPWVKTSLAPGSRVVTDYLERAGLLEPLDQLRFNLVGYGCTTCIGNSGPLPDALEAAISEHELAVGAVLSGNRNFEGRVHQKVRAAYLASPPLVVAYALAGSLDVDLTREPLGTDADGEPVLLADIWPSMDEVRDVVAASITPDLYEKEYGTIWEGDERWRALDAPTGETMQWQPDSTYVREPPFFRGMPDQPRDLADIAGLRALAVLGDSITTDHISPAGTIQPDGPAGRWLIEHGVEPRDFNSYGARRGNHEVMVRGTFANIRLRNEMVPGTEGGLTAHQPGGEVMTIFEAADRYREDGVPLIILAGREYGSGSSRDWAAKGTMLLGVKVVIAESFERIHRSNLVGMGVLPLEFPAGEGRASLGLDGTETFRVEGLATLAPGATVTVTATRADGSDVAFAARARVDTPVEVEYLRHGGILPMVLRQMGRG
ncbi:MAG: aconitate hydratase AcnA [Gaiellales bacterium]